MKTGRTALFIGAGIFTFLLLWVGYVGNRDAFATNFFIYASLFCLLYGLITRTKLIEKQLIQWLFFGMAIRIALLLAIPQLSDDYFRFIWDGKLLLSGINPYQFTPEEILPTLLEKDFLYFQNLFDQLNSPKYFSVYPPTNQLFFVLSSWVGGNSILLSVVTLRLLLIGFEAGVVILLWKIANLIQIDRKQIFLYALNPLVILEITGNLHFEGVMLFFLLLAFYSYLINKKRVGLWFGVAVAIKLTPLILMPILVSYIRRNLLPGFVLFSGLTIIVLFLPLAGMLPNYVESIRLYYGKFEFNAGIYYLVRTISMWRIPYNPIEYISPILTGMAGIFIIWIGWKKPLPTISANVVLAYLVYLLLHTVVHPWYLIVPLGISILTPYRIFVVWSFVVFFSYQSYTSPDNSESTILLLIQYGVILVAGYFDYLKLKLSKERVNNCI